MPCTQLTVRRVGQVTSVMCGAASAHMILLSLNFLNSESNATQQGIWTDIQLNTGTPPAGFPLVEGCGESSHPTSIEWATHPVALQKTLNARMRRQATDVITDSNEDLMAGHALKSVKQGIASAVLVENTTHWIVAFGCAHSQRRKFREVIVDGDTVTHMLVRDPANFGYPERITIDRWLTALYHVKCGTFNHKYIVVGAS